jgi:LAO/AO transport system kinase
VQQPTDINALFARARGGERGALARLLSMLEHGDAAAREIEGLAGPHTGAGYSIGITGAPGAGKSTLTAALLRRMRQDVDKVAVLAIDPSSPLSGGAILGDRVRMNQHSNDEGIFIRSMASRGQLGGLALASAAAQRLFDACDWPWLIVETVGIGQIETEVAGATDSVVVVLNPGWGDEIQANKAGLMEIADIFAINKADRPGLEQTRRDIEGALATMPREQRPAIIECIATEEHGIEALWDAIRQHRARIVASGELLRRRGARARQDLERLLSEHLRLRLQAVLHEPQMIELLQQLGAGRIDLGYALEQGLLRLQHSEASP